ncbi:HAD-IIIC family phosphatase [Actinoalloteichus caeruleus]|uniref:Methoxymalonate biosynthesis protein n=1 Tax=Actinoalloteichus caeruleus DSM 43889 TaxID=1120930 RepID=A0ABT1JDL8_ACTCY|nr:HAD-IIIC family phosphatase [Actinoalloteichus caeruleus]MCP2330593.1 methoxymalonate biosynthesis protein [Actinoalloteichus caeruleus DSM 43889]
MSQERTPLVKCLVWDLDNTLWQGTLLEDDEVRLAQAVRTVISTLDERGILQSVASKNDHDHAWRRLEELGVAEYFVHPMIGWSAKSGSIRAIADALSFAHGTIAFVDDQPTERAEVSYHLPEVRCYSADQVMTLLELPEFSPEVVTVDARRRRQMYQAGLRRVAERETFEGPDEEFLRSLELEMRIGRATAAELTRVEELTLRTSQMNATGVHYSDATLRELLDSPDHEVLVTTMSDRFGPHGAVGVLLLRTDAGVWRLRLLATSCRVVSFGAGTAILNWLSDQAARAGVHLVADFRRTSRNRMMEIAYRFAGFEEEDCACLAAIAPEDDITTLHLLPGRTDPPTTMRLTAPDLSGR